ncbi:MAG: hypothetical protein KY476_22310 [Planctomycetes bacterium]|nr:hypothetical protein [Planctomycetota bacterium]
MTGASSDIPEYVAVYCPVCDTRLTPRPWKMPRKVKCPDCYTLVRVPSISEAQARMPRKREAEPIGTYGLGQPNLHDAAPGRPVSGEPTDGSGIGTYSIEASAAQAIPDAPVFDTFGSGESMSVDDPPGGAERRPTGRDIPASERIARESLPPGTIGCPACGAVLEPPPSREDQTILCPECLEDVHVPGGTDRGNRSDEPPAAKPQANERHGQSPGATKRTVASGALKAAADRTQRPRPDSGDAASMQRAVEPENPTPRRPTVTFDAARGVMQRETVFDVMAAIRSSEPDPPPKWTFFSGVFTFPWRPGSLSRWVLMTLGFFTFGLVASGLLALAQSFYWLIVLVVFFPVLCAVALLSLSYAAAAFVPVLVDTSAGNDRVENWLEPYWKDWAVQFMYLMCLIGTSVLAGHATGWIAEQLGGAYWPVLAVVTYLVFPVVTLSSQEANSLFVPVTAPILRSVVRHWPSWLAFYAISGGVLAACGGAIALLNEWSAFAALLCSGPFLATVLLLYPRLLGRLAWRASQRRRKRKKPANVLPPENLELVSRRF